MDSQIPSRDRTTPDHFVGENAGTLEELEAKALTLLELLRARASEEGLK